MAPLLSTPGLVSPWKKKIGEWVQVWWEGPSLPTPAADLPFPRPRPLTRPHLALATPAGPHLLAMPSAGVPLSFILPLCPQNTSNSLQQCPAWRKSGLCIRWHSVRSHSMAPRCPSPHTVQPLGMLHAFLPSSYTRELSTQGPGTPGTTYHHCATYSPVLCHPRPVPAGLASPHRDKDRTT